MILEMINLNRINVFIEGEKLLVKGHSDDGSVNIPMDTMAAYITRLVRELLSPNNQTEHICTQTCKCTYAIVIGRTNTVCCMTAIDKAVPR